MPIDSNAVTRAATQTRVATGKSSAIRLSLDPQARRLRIDHGGMTSVVVWPPGCALDLLAQTGYAMPLLAAGSPGIFQPGEAIFKEGTGGDYAVVVLSGLVKQSCGLPDSGAEAIDFHGQGALLGAVECLAADLPHTGDTVAASNDVLTWLVPGNQLRRAAGASATRTAFFRIAGDALARQAQARAALHLAPVQRLAGLLAALAADFGRRTRPGLLLGGLSQADLATAAGLSEATVERTFRTWRAWGVIETGYRELAVLNLDRLRQIHREGHHSLPATGR